MLQTVFLVLSGIFLAGCVVLLIHAAHIKMRMSEAERSLEYLSLSKDWEKMGDKYQAGRLEYHSENALERGGFRNIEDAKAFLKKHKAWL